MSKFFIRASFEIISPFKSLNLLYWNSDSLYLEYFVFNLFILGYFGLFSFGFRPSVYLDLTSNSGDQKLSQNLLFCLISLPGVS